MLRKCLRKCLGLSAVITFVLSTVLTTAPLQGAQNPATEEEALALPLPTKNGYYYRRGKHDPRKVELGRLLFFDKILSGNLNTSCATCHHPLANTGDGLSLSVGEGGKGLGVTRDTGSGRHRIHERVPRNAPPIFNLGAKQFRRMFHDGRLEKASRQPSGFRSPAGLDLPDGLDNVLAAQAMFPVTSGTEMAGQAGENAIANAAAVENLPLVWSLLAERLRENPVYVDLFMRVYPDLSTPREITFTHAANAIGAFEAVAWRADNSPFDRYLRGDKRAMSREAKRGMKLFYGSFNCVSCHSGVFQTDHKFHAIAMPQIGPGKGDGPNGHADFGRERVTGARLDRYKFRTPSLRNVVLTGPWGHDGAYDSLRGIVLHHLDPQGALDEYDISQAVLSWRADLSTIDSEVMGDPDQVAAIAEACELQERRADGLQRKVSDLIAFLHALTDPASLDLRSDVPATVPSGLPLAE